MTDAFRRQLHEQNRKSWNHATRAHNSHKGDQAAFYRTGGNKLYPEEMALLGDVRGKRLVHLQCNSGQDTLSLANLGAKVLGVDISDEAIEFARRLSAESAVPANFVRSDIYDWFESAAVAPERFDVAFCSYGALIWLSDLRAWAEGVARVLVPGGRFVCVEYHLIMAAMELEDGRLVLRYPYFGGGRPLTWDDGIGDYVAMAAETVTGYEPGIENFRNPEPVHEFAWPVSEVITALLDAGLVLEHFSEYPYSNGHRPFEVFEPDPDRPRTYRPPSDGPAFPCMYALAARKS